MKKVNKKKIAIISLLFLVIVIELLALGLSSAEKIKEINIKVVDTEKKLEDFAFKINAYDSGKSGYYITLPETVNNILVKKYLISKKEINTTVENQNVLEENTVTENVTNENSIEENTVLENKTAENVIPENTIIENQNIVQENIVAEQTNEPTINTEKIDVVEMHAGDRVYLTTEELENAEITIQTEYDSKVINDTILYNNRIKLETEDELKLEIQGYLPTDLKIKEKGIDEETGTAILEKIDQNEHTIIDAYNLSLIKDETEYAFTEENEIQIILSNLDSTMEYKIYKWGNNKAEEIVDVLKFENTLSFSNNMLEPVIVCIKNETNTINSINLEDYLPTLLANSNLFGTQSLSIWGGSASEGFKFGDGTENNPYLISTGEELAYLAEQVNAGTTFEETYFQIAADIDLNNKEWTPIGNASNSFKGVIDGAGHTIANAVITITNTNNNVETYGIFGTIGGGTQETLIKNIEFNNIQVNFNVTRTISSNSYGYKIGIVTGAIYNNASIKNVTVKNSQILHDGTITARYSTGWNTNYYNPILFIGGIAGDAVYSRTSENTAGTYSIDYCYSDVDISLNVATASSYGGSGTTQVRCLGQVNIGGIIGRIKSQNSWPTNCLYSGTITSLNTNHSNGLVGPIFGADRNTTGYNSTTNMNNIWNGDNRNSYTMSSYYNNYNVYGTTFTSSVVSGNADTTTQYRRSTNSNNIRLRSRCKQRYIYK